nr:hypothetical protein [Tanacetum cinerariifolium]
GNQGGDFVPSEVEGHSNPGSQGKTIADDSGDIPSRSVGHPRGSKGPSFLV